MATSKPRTATRRTTSTETASRPEGERRSTAAPILRKRKPAPDEPVTMTPTDRVRVRAYYLSLERNGCDADPLADWLRAERELITGSEA